jgi:cysteine desulfurase
VDLEKAAEAIDGTTALVAAMLVNNEIGVIQPIGDLARMARAAGARFFCDAVQGYGRVTLPVDGCDLIAISAHKIHGPKGIGALWLRDGVEIAPLMHGGGQEGGVRSGTLSPALCAGFGVAAALNGWSLNGAVEPRWHGNINVRREGIDAGRLISELRSIAFSAGSACASGSGRPSHVLKAIGLKDVQARSSIRIGFGRYTTESEIDEAMATIKAATARQLEWAA